MKRLGVLVLLCAIERVAIADPGWSITWPAEWTDVTQEALKEPNMQAGLKQLAGQHATTEVAARADAEGHVVQVLYMAMPVTDDDDTSVPAIARSLELARNGVLKAANGAREVSYNQREVGNTLVAEQTLGLDGATKYVNVIAGVGHERMRIVQASCNASQALCATVLASLVLDPTELEPLSSVSNRVVYGVATLVGVLIGGLIGWPIILRQIRRRPAGPALMKNQGKRLLLAIGLALLVSIGLNLIFR